jgi:hypothetical protein
MDARRGRRTIPGSSRTMSLESGPEQWWHLPGISEQRAASPAAAMAPFLRSRCGSTSSSRGEEPVAAAAAAAGKPCSDRKKTLVPTPRKQISSGRDPATARAASWPQPSDSSLLIGFSWPPFTSIWMGCPAHGCSRVRSFPLRNSSLPKNFVFSFTHHAR